MRFIIGVDCEGEACVVGTPGEGIGERQAEFARRQATREANAAATALLTPARNRSSSGIITGAA